MQSMHKVRAGILSIMTCDVHSGQTFLDVLTRTFIFSWGDTVRLPAEKCLLNYSILLLKFFLKTLNHKLSSLA